MLARSSLVQLRTASICTSGWCGGVRSHRAGRLRLSGVECPCRGAVGLVCLESSADVALPITIGDLPGSGSGLAGAEASLPASKPAQERLMSLRKSSSASSIRAWRSCCTTCSWRRWPGGSPSRCATRSSLTRIVSFRRWNSRSCCWCRALLFHWTGLYKGVWRFASLPDLWNILRASVIGALVDRPGAVPLQPSGRRPALGAAALPGDPGDPAGRRRGWSTGSGRTAASTCSRPRRSSGC